MARNFLLSLPNINSGQALKEQLSHVPQYVPSPKYLASQLVIVPTRLMTLLELLLFFFFACSISGIIRVSKRLFALCIVRSGIFSVKSHRSILRSNKIFSISLFPNDEPIKPLKTDFKNNLLFQKSKLLH